MTTREKILKKLNPKFLSVTPKLSGDGDSFIDLDSDDLLVNGAKELMMRFFKNQDLCEKSRRSAERNEAELTVSTAKYNEKNEICELITERLNLHRGNNDEEVACEKPGRSLQKLKMELQEKMSAKWEEEYRKRVNENKSNSELGHEQEKKYKKKLEGSDNSEEENEEIENDIGDTSQVETSPAKGEEDFEDANAELEDDGNEGDVEFDEDDEEENNDRPETCLDNDNDKSSCASAQDNLGKDDDYESCSLIPAYQPGGGMLFGGSELTQGDEGLPQNLLSPSLRLSISESGSKISQSTIEATPKKSGPDPIEELEASFTVKSKLFSQNPWETFDLNDAFEFCSGKFPDAEDKTEAGVESPNFSHCNRDGDENEDKDNDDDDDDDDGDDDDTDDDGDGKGDCVDRPENSQEDEGSKLEIGSDKQTFKSRKFQKIKVFDDSEEEEETKEPDEAEEHPSGLLKVFSDDEDESSEKQKMKKTWKNLLFSDEEEASRECGNDEKSREEEDDISDEESVEEEDDQRSILYDSEENEINPREFFEKEAELSGSEWSGDEDERGLDVFDMEEGDADILDNDQVRSQLEKIHMRRVLDDDLREVRLIQEILFEDGDLHSNGKRRDRKFKWKNLGAFEHDNEGSGKDDGGNDSEDDVVEEEEFRKIRHEKEMFLMTKKKNGELSSDDEIVTDFQSVKVTTVKTSVLTKGIDKMKNSQTIAGASETAKTTIFSSTRGSFLSRNEEFLSRLAKATSGVTDVLGAKNSKNFVFAAKSPEKKDFERSAISKRQIEDSESCSRREKKIKLLHRHVDTGPSIVDLLV